VRSGGAFIRLVHSGFRRMWTGLQSAHGIRPEQHTVTDPWAVLGLHPMPPSARDHGTRKDRGYGSAVRIPFSIANRAAAPRVDTPIFV
jgi:hypothetical protein